MGSKKKMKYYTFCIQMEQDGEKVVFSEVMTEERLQSVTETLKKAYSFSVTDWSGAEIVSRQKSEQEIEEIVKNGVQ